MSTEANKTPRLLAAAKEFNIGKDTLVEYLANKGFDFNASNPNTKLSEPMYEALTAEFAQDKAAKHRSDQIALPKNTGERKKEAEPVAKKSEPAEVKKTETPEPATKVAEVEPTLPKAVAKPIAAEVEVPKEELTKVEVPKVELPEPPIIKKKPVAAVEEIPAPPVEAAVDKKPVVKEEVPKASLAEPKATTPVPELVPEKAPKEVPSKIQEKEIPAEPTSQLTKQEDAHIETKAPKLGGPNILGRINLDDLNQSTRPKKGVVKKTAEKPAAVAPKETARKKKEDTKPTVVAKATPAVEKKPVKKVETPVAAEVKPKIVVPTQPTPPAAEDVKVEHIEMKAPQLTGPKIIGRIELPVAEPGRGNNSAEKRNRKRIPVAKRADTPARTGGAQGGGQQAGAGQGGYNRSGGGGQNRGPGGGPNRGAGGGPNRGGGGFRPGGGTGTSQNGEVDSKEIQRKIQETQARLSGGRGGGKGQKAKYRRDKREMMAEKRAASENSEGGNLLQVTEFISVSELANLMDVSFAEVIGKCMSLGIMVSINQRLDAEVIELVAAEFGFEASFINLEQEADMEAEEEIDDSEDQLPRAPIVTIMGHVDHGKTSLLDYIRSANVVAGEAGGITQHIGAYQVKTANDKRITFLDTPGHEAFTAMRARGAKVADVAVIVIAADDAIMPQTKEAISHAQAAGLPMIFALNKIDKEGANPEKIREQLSGMNILVEEWGGKFQSQEISAKKGLNIDLLLEKIGLEAEILDLKANPERIATGSVIEASLDKGRGYVATILVQNGTLKQGDMIVSGQHYGRVKAMLNERGQRVTQAGPSAPVQVLGLNGAPQAGEKFKMFDSEVDAKDVATHRAQIMREQGIRARKVLTLDEIGRRLALGNFRELPLIIKGDFDGSVEALSDSLQKLSTPEVAVNVVMKGVGAVTESDINLAVASGAIVIGFQVRPTAQASRLAEQESVEIRNYSIIYDAIAEIKSAMEGLLEPTVEKKVVANVEVRSVFKITGVGTVAGCYVLDGKIFRNSKINLIRDGIVVFNGELASLKRFKDDVKEVNFGYECGMNIKNYNDIREGDIIEAYEEVSVKRTL